MEATSSRNDNLFSFDSSLRTPLIASVLFHIFVILGFTVGLPVLSPPPDISVPISVELVEIGDITQTIKAAPPKKVDEKKPEQAPPENELKPPEMKKPPPEKIEEPKPPEPEKIEQVEPKPEPKPVEKPPEEKPKEKPKPPEPKKEEPKKEEPKEDPKEQEDFESLLKNLAPATPVSEEEVAEATEETTPEQTLNTPNLGEKMTVSEEDAFEARFREQFRPCWNIPIGAKDAETLAVEIRITVTPNKTIQQAVILDQDRYNRDPAFRSMADSARRALQNPMCSSQPLPLPDGKYNVWKTIVVNFDPREML